MHDDNDRITLLAVPPLQGLKWSGKLYIGTEEIGDLFGPSLSDLEEAAHELGFPPDRIQFATS